MPKITLERVHKALLHLGVPNSYHHQIITYLQADRTGDSPWAKILQPLDIALRSLRSGKAKWRPNRVDTYAAYEQLMVRVQAEITADMRQYETPQACAKAQAALNEEREAKGQRPMGTKDGHWSMWVPPHIREATALAFDKLYADELQDGRPPGRRLYPFTTITQRGQYRTLWDNLLKQLQPHINAGYELHPALIEEQSRHLPLEATTERAAFAKSLQHVHRERYRAAFTARRIIQQRMAAATAGPPPTSADDLRAALVVPKHWVHVLEAPERARLRDAERALPGGDGYTRESFGKLPNAGLELIRANTGMVRDTDAEPLPEIRGGA